MAAAVFFAGAGLGAEAGEAARKRKSAAAAQRRTADLALGFLVMIILFFVGDEEYNFLAASKVTRSCRVCDFIL
jgi:preprotein translocase subunit SecG